jgi:pimeloyl-ACP methyl ester carboxylesterase
VGPDPARDQRTAVANAPAFLDPIRDPELPSLDLARLRAFTGPALVTIGERTAPYFATIVDAVVRALPRGERRTIAGVDHEPVHSQPDAYAGVLAGFLREARASA